MKRSAPPARHGGFLSQKKIHSYLAPPTKEVVVPLSELFGCYEPERGNPLTSELRHAMLYSVQGQLNAFKQASEQPLVCAFNGEHRHSEYVASHYIRYFDDLCNAFLKMFSSFRLPAGYDTANGGGFLAEDEAFEGAWTSFHQRSAKLRILCRRCHLECIAPHYKVKKPFDVSVPVPSPRKPLSVNEALRPYSKQVDHPWLSLASWGEPTEKGNYSRKLGAKQFTLFQRDGKWRYAYDNKFGDTSYESVKEAIEASYVAFGETIRRYG